MGEYALFPYGGAGPLHAVAVAEECGITRVVVPIEPGTLCARGILLSDVSLDLVCSEIIEASADHWPRIEAHLAAMRTEGEAWLEGEAIPKPRRRFEAVIDARYKGQNHEVRVRLDPDGTTVGHFLTGFRAAHRREYGYDIADRAVEVVNCRLQAIGLIDRPRAGFHAVSDRPEPKAHRPVHFDTGWTETPIYDRNTLGSAITLHGPAVIDEMSATTLVPPGWSVTVDPAGNLVLEVQP